MTDNLTKREDLLFIYKNPAFKGKLKNFSVSSNKSNVFCGDTVTLELEIKDKLITDARYYGDACSVSIISSELLLDHIIGKNLVEVKDLTKDDILNMVSIPLTTSRVKCATLIFDALQDALNKYENS